LPPFGSPLALLRSTEWLLSVSAPELSPERAIRKLSAPTLLICGELDHKVGPQASRCSGRWRRSSPRAWAYLIRPPPL